MIPRELMFSRMTLSDLSPVANHLWQSTLCVGAVWVLALALKKNHAAVRYWLWLAASVKFLIPFSLLVGVGSQLGWRAVPTTIAQPQWSSVVEDIGRPFAASTPAIQAVTPSVSNPFPAILFVVWFCGFAVSIVGWFLCWQKMRSARKGATPLALGLPIPVMSSSSRLEPGVFGIRKPVLLLPEGIANRLTPEQLRAVVAHEMWHVRRRDNLTAAVHMIVEAIFWFYPLVWLIRARLVEERERACDEAVLQSGSDPETYAEGILSVCKFYVASSLPCVSGIGGSDLKQRIAHIMTQGLAEKLSSGRKVLLALTGISVVAAPVIYGVLNAPPVAAQTESQPTTQASAKPQFEVASLSPDKDCENKPAGPVNFSPFPGRLQMPCVNLRNLIQAAYGTFGDGVSINTQPLHLEGGPPWMDSQHYSLLANAEVPVRTEMMAGPMLQALLEERFRLKTHREMREMPVYAMTVTKHGLKMQPEAEGACAPLDLTHPPAPPKPGDPPTSPRCGAMLIRPADGGKMIIEVQGATMTQVAQRLSGRVDRTVVDKTGVPGKFNFHLEFTPDSEMVGQGAPAHGGNPGNPANPDNAASPPDAGTNIFVALQEQLGLKLESAKGPVEVLVIDHVEKPSEN